MLHILPSSLPALKTGLSEKAMLAGVTISEWSGKKLDRKVTADAIAASGAEADAGRFNKALIPPVAFARIRDISGRARKEHYARTLPWHDNGNRVLSNIGYLDFTAAMRGLRAEYADAVAEFVAAYPVHIAAARKRLGDMFDESEFPSAADLPRRFSFDWNIWPMPDASDFRVDVGQVEAERIRADIEDRTNAAIDAAMGDAFQRVADVVGKMADRLASDREVTRKNEAGAVIGLENAAPIFRDSLVENVAELAALLPSLNITGNPALAHAAARMKELGAIDVKALRNPKAAGTALRQETAKGGRRYPCRYRRFYGLALYLASPAPALAPGWPSMALKPHEPPLSKVTEMQMTTAAAIESIAYLMAVNEPVMLKGKSGIGKSDICAQSAAAPSSWAPHGADCVDIRLSMYDPVDLRGLPTIQGDKVVWIKPQELFRQRTRPVVFLLDEIDRAAPATQNVALQFVLNRRIGEHEAPKDCRILAARNGKHDHTGTGKLSVALARRFTHIDLVADPVAWCDWAAGAGLDPALVAFIRFRPLLLTQLSDGRGSNGQMATDKDSEDGDTGVNPRSWATLDKFVAAPDAIRLGLMSGKVGMGPAAEFEAFLGMVKGFPYSLDSIIADPANAPIPHEPGLLYAVASGLARKATDRNLAAINQYGQRLPVVDYHVAMMTEATRRNPALLETGAYGQWATSARAKAVTV